MTKDRNPPDTQVGKGNKTSTIDFQDPLYVHPSDTPNLDLVTEVLRGSENYKVWSREMIVALEAKNKIGFIDGTCKAPEPDSHLFHHWKRCNALVKSWIHRSLSRDLIHGVVYCDSAYLIWIDLKERFDRINGARLYALYRQINTITQGTHNVTDYYSKLRQLWDEYDSLTPSPSRDISKEYIEFCGQLKMMQFLMGLNECYGTIRSQILMMSPLPTHGQVYSMVSNEETQRGINVQNTGVESSMALLSNSTQNKSVDISSLLCDHCNFNGHTRENCFKLHGYPPNWSRGGRRGGARGNVTGRGYNVNSASSSNNTQNGSSNTDIKGNTVVAQPALTNEQYQQILHAIGSMSTDQSQNNGSTTNLASTDNTGNLDWIDQGDW